LKDERWESTKSNEERKVKKHTPQENPEEEFSRPVSLLGNKVP